MRLYLIRHGQTESNVQGALDTGDPGAPLTALGWEQAESLVDRLEALDLDLIVTSTLLRTQQTAAPLARTRELVPVVDERVREILAGDLEMKTDADSVLTYQRTADKWSDGDLDIRMPGAENGHEVLARFDKAIEQAQNLLGGAGSAVVVAHGALLRTWTRLRARNSLAIPLPYVENTGILEVVGEPGSWDLEGWMEL